jgi:hypothetical protein
MDIEFIPSSFGGGWLVPLVEKGREATEAHFGEPPHNQTALGGQPGYILEPWEVRGTIRALREGGCTVGLYWED